MQAERSDAQLGVKNASFTLNPEVGSISDEVVATTYELMRITYEDISITYGDIFTRCEVRFAAS
jgi:hypothetical protein